MPAPDEGAVNLEKDMSDYFYVSFAASLQGECPNNQQILLNISLLGRGSFSSASFFFSFSGDSSFSLKLLIFFRLNPNLHPPLLLLKRRNRKQSRKKSLLVLRRNSISLVRSEGGASMLAAACNYGLPRPCLTDARRK